MAASGGGFGLGRERAAMLGVLALAAAGCLLGLLIWRTAPDRLAAEV